METLDWGISEELGETGENGNTYALSTKREVKMAEKNAKKERSQYPAILTEQAWSIKDLLYGKRLHQTILLLREQSGKSRAGKIGPSCPLG